MNFNASGGHYWQNIFTRAILVTACVAIIVWFLPRNERQRIRYDVGKPWMYGSFIAKFDFPIYKSEEAVKAERSGQRREEREAHRDRLFELRQQKRKEKKRGR